MICVSRKDPRMNTDKIRKFFETLYRSVFHKGNTDMASFDKFVYLLQFILLIVLVVVAWSI
jgi:hypothetical protein